MIGTDSPIESQCGRGILELLFPRDDIEFQVSINFEFYLKTASILRPTGTERKIFSPLNSLPPLEHSCNIDINNHRSRFASILLAHFLC